MCDVRRENSSTYREGHETGLGHLCFLGSEILGRWGDDPIDIMPKTVRAKCRGLPQSVRVCLQAALSRRWWGLVGVAVSREVARAILRCAGSDLIDHALEPPPALCDLVAGEVALSFTRLCPPGRRIQVGACVLGVPAEAPLRHLGAGALLASAA